MCITLIISRWVTLNSVAFSSIRVAMTAFREWLWRTAPAPLSSYACRLKRDQSVCMNCGGALRLFFPPFESLRIGRYCGK